MYNPVTSNLKILEEDSPVLRLLSLIPRSSIGHSVGSLSVGIWRPENETQSAVRPRLTAPSINVANCSSNSVRGRNLTVSRPLPTHSLVGLGVGWLGVFGEIKTEQGLNVIGWTLTVSLFLGGLITCWRKELPNEPSWQFGNTNKLVPESMARVKSTKGNCAHWKI